MEIFQTIWTALTTPNEGLIQLIFIPLSFLDAFVGMFLFTTVLNIDSTKKQKISYIIIYATIGLIINALVPEQYRIFVNMIIWPVIIYFTLHTTILKSILAEIVSFVSSVVLDAILIYIITNIFKTNINVLLVIPIYRLSTSLIIYFVFMILTLLVKYFKFNIEIFDNMNRKTKILLIANALLLIIVLAMQFYLIAFYSDTMPLAITIISIITLIAYFSLTIYSIINSSKLEIAARDLEGAQLQIHSLKVLHDTVRTFKHDFDNIINGIGGYISTNDTNGLKSYYHQLLQDCKKTNNMYTLNPDVINHPAIYNILATKYYVADELNTNINLDIFLDLNEIEKHMKIYDFTRILGILLDNSVEAASECEEKAINVTFRKEEKRNRILVIIENTYNNKDVNIDKIFDKGETSKPNNTGLGLWKVREILKRNNNLNLFTTKNDKYFKQQFEIYF